MTFKKGQSGNPSGRPKTTLADGRSLREISREHTDTEIATLVKIMKDDEAPPAARANAAGQILDRGWGRPTQPISGDADMPPLSFTTAPMEVVAWMAAQSIPDDAETAH